MSNILSFLILCLFLYPSLSLAESYACDKGEPDQILLWAIDTSSSLDEEEYKTQLDGYITALKSPAVQSNFLYCQCTEIGVLFWATQSELKYPFTTIKNPQDIQDLISSLEQFKQEFDREFSLGYQTYILEALQNSGQLLLDRKQSYSQPPKLMITISGDGTQNQMGPEVIQSFRDQKDDFHKNEITVNGLPVVIYEGPDSPESFSQGRNMSLIPNPKSSTPLYKDVADFYEKEVITSDGYMEKAYSYKEFAESIRKSALRDTCKLMM